MLRVDGKKQLQKHKTQAAAQPTDRGTRFSQPDLSYSPRESERIQKSINCPSLIAWGFLAPWERAIINLDNSLFAEIHLAKIIMRISYTMQRKFLDPVPLFRIFLVPEILTA